MSEGFIKDYKHKLNWKEVSRHQVLSEGLIAEADEEGLLDKECWQNICVYNKQLTEGFIERFKDKVDWTAISRWQKHISEDFIARFKDRVDWYWIGKRKNLSKIFLIDFQQYIEKGKKK